MMMNDDDNDETSKETNTSKFTNHHLTIAKNIKNKIIIKSKEEKNYIYINMREILSFLCK